MSGGEFPEWAGRSYGSNGAGCLNRHEFRSIGGKVIFIHQSTDSIHHIGGGIKIILEPPMTQ